MIEILGSTPTTIRRTPFGSTDRVRSSRQLRPCLPSLVVVIGSRLCVRLLGQSQFSQPGCLEVLRSASELRATFCRTRAHRRLLDTLEHILGMLAGSRNDHLHTCELAPTMLLTRGRRNRTRGLTILSRVFLTLAVPAPVRPQWPRVAPT
jgi:hypothetical protein